MPRKPCYWTRQLELDLVEFVKQREFIWKPIGNTNHHIQQKYKAYAEFATNLGCGFTARSVRDRWVNIRTTFNHNLRRVDKSRESATSVTGVYVPCWPLWKPLQFLKEVTKKEDNDNIQYMYTEVKEPSDFEVKTESNQTEDLELNIRQRIDRTDRPRKRSILTSRLEKRKTNKCVNVLNDLLTAMAPLLCDDIENQQYWFFGRHVTERLNLMRHIDAECASHEIITLLNEITDNNYKPEDSMS